MRRQNEPFSRIKKTVQVDSRFHGEWVQNDYDQQIYNDLAVVKGNGFTKQKNKMKRGSFRAGAIDMNQRAGVRFED